jgi:hypothetical protein
MKKLLSELPMLGFGAGVAVAGASLAFIGLYGVRKNFYIGGMIIGGGALASGWGSQIAIGAIERVRGLR